MCLVSTQFCDYVVGTRVQQDASVSGASTRSTDVGSADVYEEQRRRQRHSSSDRDAQDIQALHRKVNDTTTCTRRFSVEC